MRYDHLPISPDHQRESRGWTRESPMAQEIAAKKVRAIRSRAARAMRHRRPGARR